MDLLSLAMGGAGVVLLAVLGLVVKQVLSKVMSSSAGRPGPGIVITNTGSSANAEAENTGRHSVAPAPAESEPAEVVCESKCAERRAQLADADSRSGAATRRLEKKIDGVKADLVEIKVSVAGLSASVDTMAKAVQREYDGLQARVERLESAEARR
jgi:hypothetical protein